MTFLFIILGAGLSLIIVLSGYVFLNKLLEKRYLSSISSQPEDEVGEDPDWPKIMQSTIDFSDEPEIFNELYSLYRNPGSVDIAPDCPLLMDPSGSIRFTIESYCGFIKKISQKVQSVLQAMEYPRDYEDQDFMDMSAAVLLNGGWVGFIIQNTQALFQFDKWKNYTMRNLLKRGIKDVDISNQTMQSKLDSYLKKLVLLPAFSNSVFSFNQAYIRLRIEHHPIIGVGARRGRDKKTAYLISMAPYDAEKNFEIIKEDLMAALSFYAEKQPEFAPRIRELGDWLLHSGAIDKSIRDTLENTIERNLKVQDIPLPPETVIGGKTFFKNVDFLNLEERKVSSDN